MIILKPQIIGKNNMITGFYAGLLGLMLVVLILRVALRRRKYKVGLGDGGIADLGQAIRVHGNFVETAPVMLILLLLLESSHSQALILHSCGLSIVLSRLLHAYGITSSPLASNGRKYGVLLTFIVIIVSSILLISKYLSNIIT
ncbi:MAG: glutathione S-transferase [Micavibrio aeruginosavorus]|uniref:Glutathione S-transferase n=1 Tax=Micavibrio aeruginosavorus TaxID=349221 RepID=A0A2W5HIN8_9BACT|nr:MAG: glutathione S-transferase [Micavibrio aeruginosavorus]